MITIIDYGVGNLFSLTSSLKFIGADVKVTGDKEEIANAEKIILPGVGAFSDAAAKLRENGLDQVVKEAAAKGTPLLGICLGMQLLFEKSLEYGEHEGLGLIPGQIISIADTISEEDYKIPQIGWNSLKLYGDCPIFKYISEGDFVYFVHSYYGVTDSKYVTATTEYGAELTAAVSAGNVYGCQFHPEKSGDVGLSILKAYNEL